MSASRATSTCANSTQSGESGSESTCGQACVFAATRDVTSMTRAASARATNASNARRKEAKTPLRPLQRQSKWKKAIARTIAPTLGRLHQSGDSTGTTRLRPSRKVRPSAPRAQGSPPWRKHKSLQRSFQAPQRLDARVRPNAAEAGQSAPAAIVPDK